LRDLLNEVEELFVALSRAGPDEAGHTPLRLKLTYSFTSRLQQPFNAHRLPFIWHRHQQLALNTSQHPKKTWRRKTTTKQYDTRMTQKGTKKKESALSPGTKPHGK